MTSSGTSDTQVVKAQVLYGPKDLRLISKNIELPGNGDVQIAMKATTLCGSDVHYYTHYRNGDIQIREPLSQGHECAGQIMALGEGVAATHGLAVGDRVAVEVGVPCDHCTLCRDGNYNICEKMRFRSSATAFPHFQGTLQERFNHPAKWVHKLPDSLSYAEGALLEPLAVAIHSVRKAEARAESSCLIIGTGAVGLLCAAAARNANYGKIVMADIAGSRLEFAKKHKFTDEVVLLQPRRADNIDEGLETAKDDAAKLVALNFQERFSRTFECTGVESCVRIAIHATQSGGKILLVGMGTPVQTLPLSAAALREVDLIGVWRYANCYPEAISMMQKAGSGEAVPNLKHLLTHSLRGLEKVPEAFSLAARTSDENDKIVIKVVVETD